MDKVHRWPTALCALAAGLVLVFAAPAIADDDAQEQLSGTWEPTPSTEAARQTVEAAIEEIVADMSVFGRPIARGRLRDTTEPCSTLEIAFPDNTIRVQCEDQPPTVSPNSPSLVNYRAEDGAIYQIGQQQSAGVLRQIFYGKDGMRTNRLSLAPDGETIEMDVTVESDQLPYPLEYSLTFEKRSER